MDLLHLIALGIVQGLTEFLPISSSAHLIMLPRVFGWPDQGLAFDVAAHVGSLCAVFHYFRRDFQRMTRAWLDSLRGRDPDPEARLVWWVLLATIPLAAAGALLHEQAATVLRAPAVIIGATVLFAIALWLSDRYGARVRPQSSLALRDAIIIGLAQCLAIIPGTSRSGITITAGLMLGLDRTTAVRFSFYLAVPAIVLAGAWEGLQLARAPGSVDPAGLFIVALVSGASAWLAIHFLLKFLDRFGMTPYVIYRLVLGGVLLGVFNL